MTDITFTIPQILSIVGVVQCVHILVYMGMRAGRLSRAGLAIAYFVFMGIAFLLDFGRGYISNLSPYYPVWQWFFWMSDAPLSVLLIVQIAQITKVPPLRYFWVLLLPVLALVASYLVSRQADACVIRDQCSYFYDWLNVTGLLGGGISLLAIWMRRDLFSGILSEKVGKDRYWLILALIFANIAFLSITLVSFSGFYGDSEISVARTILGLALAYLVTTSLFRIYPQAVNIAPPRDDSLSDHEKSVAIRIERLIDMDKVYHEASYSRSDLARELGEAETSVSRIINIYFKKSLPQLLNERRIEDAKRLLGQTDANVKTIAEEVGFNSLASFNRVFKDLTGDTPSAYRKTTK